MQLYRRGGGVDAEPQPQRQGDRSGVAYAANLPPLFPGRWPSRGKDGIRPDPAQTLVHLYTNTEMGGAVMAQRHCSSSRDGKVLLSCWITPELRMQLDQVWADRGLRPHGRTQKGMEEMITLYLAAQSQH
jgi:hypothetical protein